MATTGESATTSYDLAMFPLSTALVPGTPLPLRIFEPRYQVLLHDMRVGDIPEEFGVVLIDRGTEIGGGDARFRVGCVAEVLSIEPMEVDGHWRVLTMGGRRIRVHEWLPEDPYPRAHVEDWPDPPVTERAGMLLEQAVPKLRRVLALASELGAPVPNIDLELAADPVDASYQLARMAPMGELDRVSMLSATTVEERLEQALRLLDEARTLLALRLERG